MADMGDMGYTIRNRFQTSVKRGLSSKRAFKILR